VVAGGRFPTLALEYLQSVPRRKPAEKLETTLVACTGVECVPETSTGVALQLQTERPRRE